VRGLSLNSVLLAKSRVLKRLRKELTGLVEGAVPAQPEGTPGRKEAGKCP